MALLRHTHRVTADEELALDALQASLLLIARRLKSLRDPRWFRAWAYRIATREAVRLAKRRGRERRLFLEDVPVEAAEAPLPDDDEASELLRSCAAWIERLPAASGVVVSLHYLDGLTLVEIAEALEVPLGTVKSRLAYGLSQLRKRIAA